MRERRVGIRKLKSKLSVLRDVRAGATVVVAEHGRRVARIVPEAQPRDERRTVTDIVVENRASATSR